MPYSSPAGRTYDSGDFAAVLDRALAVADWDGFAAREAASKMAGLIRGRGLCCFPECVGGLLYESADLRFAAHGGLRLVVATPSSGPGHETSFAQLVAHWLGVPEGAVRLRQGDSRDVPRGLASIASRSLLMAGSAISLACDKVIEKGRRAAAHLLEVAEPDLEFQEGVFRVAGTDRGIGLLELTRRLREAQIGRAHV